MTRTYLDANALVFAFGDPTHARRRGARAAIERAAEQGDLVTCALTMDEFLRARTRESDRPTAVQDTRTLLRAPFLLIVPVNLDHVTVAVDLVEDPGLDPRDAIHAAVAQATRCTRFLSDDPRFDSVPGLVRTPP